MTTSRVLLRSAEGQITEKPRSVVFERYANVGSRFLMVVVIAAIFLGLNYEVMTFVETAFDADLALLKTSPSASRIVTTTVLVSLVGGTVVQVGVATIAIVSYLFPKP